MTSAHCAPQTRWLDPDERLTWLALVALTSMLPASIDTQLSRDSGLSFFEYSVLAALSEQPDRTMPMSNLAMLANGSLSRLSHAARRLEDRGYIRRRPLPENGRITVAELLDQGYAAITAAAPGHIQHVRRAVFDPFTPDEQFELGRLVLKLLECLDREIPGRLRAIAATEGVLGDQEATGFAWRERTVD